jgi:hypothetical protein
MSIKYWISSGESEQFENCKNEVQLFDRLDEEFKPLRERLGDLIGRDWECLLGESCVYAGS